MNNTKTIQELDQQYILQTYNRYPIVLTNAKGMNVWDAEGNQYLDFLGGIAVNPLGHCHPAVIEAILKQVNTLMHVSNLYYTKPATELAKLLVENGGLEKIFFCNSGAEANEAAIKLARKYQWRKDLKNKYNIVAFSHSFHGRTFGALAATNKPEIQQGFGPMLTGFNFSEFNNIAVLEKNIDVNTAAVIVEPIQGEAGIYPATKEFLQALRKRCDQVGAVLIFDEIQCGLGRTGTFFAYQHYGVKPDVITLAKGIASGLAFGAICVSNEVGTGFQLGDHATTFGGNPVAAAAAMATIKIILAENYIENTKALGNYLSRQLHLLKENYPDAIAEIRGAGLMLGIELKIDAKKVLEYCHVNGLLANVTAGNVLRLLPPYIVTKDDIDTALKIIEMAIYKHSLSLRNDRHSDRTLQFT